MPFAEEVDPPTGGYLLTTDGYTTQDPVEVDPPTGGYLLTTDGYTKPPTVSVTPPSGGYLLVVIPPVATWTVGPAVSNDVPWSAHVHDA